MILKKLLNKTVLIAAVVGAILLATVLVACTGGPAREQGQESGEARVGQEVTETGGGEAGGEHGGGGEAGAEGGGEAAGTGSEEGSGANQLAPDETFDMVRAGARLVLNYDAQGNSFVGSVENTTNAVLTNVRVEVHLSNGTELGPTTPVDLAPGEVVPINLAATAEPFTGWTPHAEVGGGEGGQAGGESGVEGPEGTERGGTGVEAGEAAMSSPVIPLDQTWQGNLGGLEVSARYDAATRSVQATVQNTLDQVLCYVQAEPHLKSGTQTVGELGPDVLGHLGPGQSAMSSVSVDTEPSLAGVAYDGYVVHLEVFDCAGSGPVPHTGGEGAEGGGGEGAGGEGHGPGGESGGEGAGSGAEEGSGTNQLAPDETFDAVRAGARLILSYDPQVNAFVGTVHNTTNAVLSNVRIEVHLPNGTELGPTIPIDLGPDQIAPVVLPSTQGPFTGWVAHAEVGGGEGGGEHGGTGGEGTENSVSEAGREPGAEGGGSGVEGSGEHVDTGGEGTEGSGTEGGGESGGEEGSGVNQLAPDEIFDSIRSGARLTLIFDTQSNSFVGTVQNTTNDILTRVRIEVHLSNGTELGPTTPIDLAPGETADIILPSTQASFTGWVAHAEVGGGEGGGGEHGSGTEDQAGG